MNEQPTQKQKHHELFFLWPTAYKVSNPGTKELQFSNRMKINMTTFFIEKSCNPLLAPMQNKEDPTSFINMASMGKIA